ncbi:transmembrane amino acid transporter protein-domain-containing protein [Fusarium tricinctum]|uniref:Transmembrane amino acid transporter protein-domain-containing protein n=1 Tax=Fusarium tricinctum TaxID=61284 RepID=A0A8K0S199_9HYPO|nr:transmembrane amino acid transporter protein-domain-containing protein [Fusarium tricinctum]
MRSHTIRSAAKGGNGLASAPLQLSKYDDEDSPSRDAVFGEISDEGPDYRSVGLIGTAGLMMKTQIGLGVLSIPATFNALGMIPGIICLLTVAIVTTWSNWIVGIFKLRHRHVYAIDDAGGMMFGAVGREFFGFAMWIYWVFVSGAGMLGLSIGLNAVSNHGACTAVFVAVAAVLGFVLSSIRTLGRMSWLAWVGVISIMISVIMVTIATGVQERPAAAPKEGVWVSDYKLFNTPSFVQAASSICSLISAYGGTPGFFAIVAEMRRPEQYTRALIICQSIVTVTYLIIGCLMYYFCGSYVSSPALGSAGDTIKKASYGVAIPGLIVSITLVTHLPSKYMFVRLLRNTKHLASNSLVHWSTWLGCTFIVSIIAYIIASAIPIFYSLVSLIGALVGTLMCFQAMGFMWFYDNWENRTISPKWISACGWASFVIASGTLLMVAGTYGSIVEIIQAYKAAGGSGAWSCADNSNSS